jgi:hypothetical protein
MGFPTSSRSLELRQRAEMQALKGQYFQFLVLL